MVSKTNTRKTVLFLTGPTAVGKTAVALAVAKALNTAIISADSRQCYTGMAIGTAQPAAAEQAAVPHYFINTFSPEETISAAHFERLALGWLDDIFRHSDFAVVCGGTGLYIRALSDGLDPMPVVDLVIGSEITEQTDLHGLPWLQERVAAEDPAFWAVAEQENGRRLARALAFIRTTGQSITAYRSGKAQQRPFAAIKVYLDLPRPELYARINARVDRMMAAGLEAEARALLPFRNCKSLDTVGYAEMFAFFDGRLTRDEAVEKIRQHSRNYAKRQETWFRKRPEFLRFDAADPDVADKILRLVRERAETPAAGA